MAWTTPKRWAFNELVTAAMMNTHVRDNLNASETATVTTAGDMVYATGANAITRLGAASGNSFLTSASSGSVPAWQYHWWPLLILTTASTITVSDGGGATLDLFVSASSTPFLGTTNAIYFSTYLTLHHAGGSAAQFEIQFRAGSSGCYLGNWVASAASHTTSASDRGGWYSAWIVDKSSTCKDVFLMGPRNASLMPILGADSDMYFTQASTTLAPCVYSITYSYQPGSCQVLTCHYVGIWGVRAV